MTDTDVTSEQSATTHSDDLTVQDFAEHSLPQRPVRYRPEYRQDLRHFIFICSAIMVFLVALTVFQLF